MGELIRINQKITQSEDAEIYDFLSKFGDRARATQARKLMLLGLVELNRLASGVQEPVEASTVRKQAPDLDNEQELIVDSGVNSLFD